MSSITDGLYPRVARRYVSFPISQLIMFVRNVITMMTGNPDYAAPSPTLPVVTTAVNDLEVKAQAALNGGKVEMAARRAAEATVLSLTRQLGNYVESAANGDLETLIGSGFEAVRAPSPSVIPDVPANPRLGYTKSSGELMFRFAGGYNVKNYSIQHAESVDGPWIDDDLSTSSRVLLTGLTPGKIYWARACANGAAGSSDYCAPVSQMAI
jgi:hypothetical protein